MIFHGIFIIFNILYVYFDLSQHSEEVIDKCLKKKKKKKKKQIVTFHGIFIIFNILYVYFDLSQHSEEVIDKYLKKKRDCDFPWHFHHF